MTNPTFITTLAVQLRSSTARAALGPEFQFKIHFHDLGLVVD